MSPSLSSWSWTLPRSAGAPPESLRASICARRVCGVLPFPSHRCLQSVQTESRARRVGSLSHEKRMKLCDKIRQEDGLFPLGGNHLGEIDDTLRVTPLVVVPGDDLDHVVTHDHGEGRVDGGRDVSHLVVAGHERLVGDGVGAAGGVRASRRRLRPRTARAGSTRRCRPASAPTAMGMD